VHFSATWRRDGVSCLQGKIATKFIFEPQITKEAEVSGKIPMQIKEKAYTSHRKCYHLIRTQLDPNYVTQSIIMPRTIGVRSHLSMGRLFAVSAVNAWLGKTFVPPTAFPFASVLSFVADTMYLTSHRTKQALPRKLSTRRMRRRAQALLFHRRLLRPLLVDRRPYRRPRRPSMPRHADYTAPCPSGEAMM
jgi:hypothetical protein